MSFLLFPHAQLFKLPPETGKLNLIQILSWTDVVSASSFMWLLTLTIVRLLYVTATKTALRLTSITADISQCPRSFVDTIISQVYAAGGYFHVTQIQLCAIFRHVLYRFEGQKEIMESQYSEIKHGCSQKRRSSG